MAKKKLVVVDADTIVFRSAAVAEQRTVEVEHLPSGRKKVYNNRTQFKKAMQEKGYSVKPEEFSFVDIQEPEPIAHCLHNIKLQADGIIERFSDADVIFCAGDKNNFRLDLPLPTRYKSNRDGMIRPYHLKEAKEYFISKYNAKSADGYEADDLSSIIAYEGLNAGRNVLLCSPDKDSKQFVGLKIFDYTNPEKGVIEVSNWHPVELNTKKEFKSYGIPFLAYQMSRGDGSDGYWPYKLTGKDFGDSGAFKLLSTCKTPRECLEAVVEQYKAWYPAPVTYKAWDDVECTKDWKELLQLYWSCAYMLRSYDDQITAEEFFDMYEVKL